MRDDVGLPRIVIEERGGGPGAFLLGVLVGAGAALLLAPRSGRETQREIAGVVGGLREAAEGRLDDTRTSVTGLVHRSREAVAGRVHAVRGAVDTKVTQARTAVHEGRSAASQARAELQRRVEEAKAAYRSGQRPEGPRPPALQLVPATPPAGRTAGAVVQEVVITEVTTEPHAGDLAGPGDPPR